MRRVNEAIANARAAAIARGELDFNVQAGALTETAYVQLMHRGIACIDVGFPTRYTHSAVEVCDAADLECLTRLLIAAVGRIDDEGNIWITGRSKFVIVLESGEKIWTTAPSLFIGVIVAGPDVEEAQAELDRVAQVRPGIGSAAKLRQPEVHGPVVHPGKLNVTRAAPALTGQPSVTDSPCRVRSNPLSDWAMVSIG